MNDYNELIERCKEILEWKKTGLLNGDALREYANRQPYGSEYNKLAIAEAVTLKDAAEAFVDLAARIAELESRLEISPLHNVDGIMARDATIKLQDERIAELEAERAEREKQAPVAWLDRSTEERPGDTVWLPDDLQGMSTRGLVPLYAAPPVITQHEPVTTVDDRYNADGKSCHITDDLPAGMPLYAAPPVAAPVRLTDKQIFEMADERCFLGTVKEIASAVETAVLRANGFKVEE